LAYREIKEESIRQRAKEIKKPFFASFTTEAGIRYRKQQFGYPYEWNGLLFYSERPEPAAGIWLTESRSGVKIEYSKLCKVYNNDIEALLSKLETFGLVKNLPSYEEVMH
jgi:hypothetical protein